MRLHVIYVFTHDSIALGEDGPTHQPVEQLLGLRSIPNFILIRPADANETAAAWRVAIEKKNAPVALALTRQKLPVFDPDRYPQITEGVRAGGYVLEEVPNGQVPALTLVATGSEVQLALEASQQLAGQGIQARVVSLPSWNLFQEQTQEYRDQVIRPEVPILALEAGVSLGWKPYVGPGIPAISVDKFGASAPGEKVYKAYGFSVENVVNRARELIQGRH
jgi:transketolase